MIIINNKKKVNSRFHPLISIITVTYNRAKYLEKTRDYKESQTKGPN